MYTIIIIFLLLTFFLITQSKTDGYVEKIQKIAMERGEDKPITKLSKKWHFSNGLQKASLGLIMLFLPLEWKSLLIVIPFSMYSHLFFNVMSAKRNGKPFYYLGETSMIDKFLKPIESFLWILEIIIIALGVALYFFIP